MTKQIIAIAALLAATAAHAEAQNPVYVSIAGGVSQANIDCTGVSRCDDTGSGARAAIGYDFGNGFSL